MYWNSSGFFSILDWLVYGFLEGSNITDITAMGILRKYGVRKLSVND